MPVLRVKFCVLSGRDEVIVHRLVHDFGYRVFGFNCGGISLLKWSGSLAPSPIVSSIVPAGTFPVSFACVVGGGGATMNQYIGLEVLCGGTSTNDSGVTQWGVCRYPWLWEYGERLLVGK